MSKDNLRANEEIGMEEQPKPSGKSGREKLAPISTISGAVDGAGSGADGGGEAGGKRKHRRRRGGNADGVAGSATSLERENEEVRRVGDIVGLILRKLRKAG